jgi:saccharopine dehydrogenase (NAD+, L-lysine-forming)
LTAGYKITVEEFKDRIFPVEEYAAVGCTVAPANSWKTAPADAFIVGLKELPEDDVSPLTHDHVFFAHCFKKQRGWAELLKRFIDGKGTIYDLEFLNDEQGGYSDPTNLCSQPLADLQATLYDTQQ